MTAPLDLDDLRQGLLDKLRVVLHIHEPEADSNKDSFIVDAHKYVLKLLYRKPRFRIHLN